MLEQIRKLYIFEWLDEDFLKGFLKNSKVKNFKKNEIVINQWDESNVAYILISWIVSVFKWVKNISTIFEWDIFWEISLVLNEKRTASIKAETDIKVLVFSKEFLNEYLDNYPNWSYIKNTILNRIIQNNKI